MLVRPILSHQTCVLLVCLEPYGIPCAQLKTTPTITYLAEELETLFNIFHGRPAMPIEIDRLQCFLRHNQDNLLAHCKHNDVITGARYVCSLNVFPFVHEL